MPYLIQRGADGVGSKQWDLAPSLTVGRGDDVNITVDDENMSRRHFEIVEKDGGYVVRDLQSRNGTFVNNQKVTESPLGIGDTIRAGATSFVLVEGVNTVIGQLAQNGASYNSFVRKLK